MIVELLPTGKQNRVSLEYLMNATKCNSVRDIRRIIATERKQGNIILSCPEGGYYLPGNRGEVERYVNTMSKEARSIFYMLKSARQHLKETEKEGEQVEQ